MPKVPSKSKAVRLSGGSRLDVILSAATGSRVVQENELKRREKELEKRQQALEQAEASLARRRIVEASLEAGYRLDPITYDEMDEYVDARAYGINDDDPMDGGAGDYDARASDEDEGGGGSDDDNDDDDNDDDAATYLAKLYSGSKTSRPPRSRKANAANLHAKWAEQTPVLVNVYLKWKAGSYSPSPVPFTAASDVAARSLVVFCISLSDAYPIEIATSEPPNVALVQRGFLAGTTDKPKVAFALECLEFYRQLRTRHASLGIQAWVKTLCAILQLTYRDSIRNVFSLAFDGYLAIHRLLQERVDYALGREAPDWHAKHDCPACGHKVLGEPRIVPDRLHAIDGNESARRLFGCGSTDGRQFRSGHWIYPEEVDRYADEVPSRPTRNGKGKGKQTSRPAADEEGDELCPSVENWKAERAQTESRSVTAVFDQTGIFLTTCRHGIVEKVEEMVRSGELAKYGLAAIAKIMENYGEDQAVGSDIGCSFGGTVARSSLGPEAKEKNLTILVNAFHGYAHKRPCQLAHHPLYLPGLGLEDLETCERIFSSLNSVAGGIRHASHFHWRQAISMHIDGLISDRYGSLSRFIYNNYRQALFIIKQADLELPKHSFSAEDYEQWRRDEIAYYRSSQKEPEEDKLKAAYVQALINLDAADEHFRRLVGATPFIVSTGGADASLSTAATSAAIEQERKAAYRKVELAERRATDLERRMGISRWEKTDKDYISALTFLNRRKFVLLVDQLSSAVVSRLQELSKMHLRSTGYKLRKQIAKNIARRGGTIKTLIGKVNKLGAALDPPMPKLSYAEVVNISYLAEFDLLKESRHDVRQQPWTLQRNRELQSLYFKSQHAREEIQRLNREVLRLQGWVDLEDERYEDAVAQLQDVEPSLASHIGSVAHSRRLQNKLHRTVLRKLYQLPGYSGPPPPLVHFRQAAIPAPAHAPASPRSASSTASPCSTTPRVDVNENAGASAVDSDGEGDDDDDDDDDGSEVADEDDDQALALFGSVLQSF